MKTRLSSSEWDIYECLWESSPQTLAQIRRRYAERTGHSMSAAETIIGRMEKKGLFHVEKGERAKLYSPLFTREEAVDEETRTFLDRMYNGNPLSLVSAMMEKGNLTEGDIDSLRQLLQKGKENSHD